jgi:hypothetical protein
VHMGFSYTYHAHKLIKLSKNSEKITLVLSILVHQHIKFQVQIHSSLPRTKKAKFLTDISVRFVEFFFFFTALSFLGILT